MSTRLPAQLQDHPRALRLYNVMYRIGSIERPQREIREKPRLEVLIPREPPVSGLELKHVGL